MTATLAIERYANAEQFLAAAQAWLLEAEAENNLLLGIALNARGHKPTDPPPYWAGVRDGSAIVGCACRTPPHRLVLSRLPASAVGALVTDVSTVYGSLNGVTGPTAEAEAFAAEWTARHGGAWQTRFRFKLHELTKVSLAGRAPPGSLRKATETDVALARDWVEAYVRDTGIDVPVEGLAQRLIERDQLFLWIDGGEPRAMAATTRPTRSGCSINTVYTPPRHRRRGYATAAVAALSDALLKGGRRFCCLYTDAANPTSNSIYAKIGYRPIRDDAELAFEA
jgi:RimJ/RimL family protein N-acetyltransferase